MKELKEIMAIVKPTMLGTTERMNFAKINEVLEMPNLIEVQKSSYQWFINEGIKEVFRDIGTIEDHTGTLALEFVDYHLEEHTKYSVKECKERDVTYAAPLKVTIRLLNKETGEIKQQEKFMGDFPKMTDSGTFIINGAERVIVSQLVRSPGAYFKLDHDKTGKKLYSGTIIPNRGAWAGRPACGGCVNYTADYHREFERHDNYDWRENSGHDSWTGSVAEEHGGIFCGKWDAGESEKNES